MVKNTAELHTKRFTVVLTLEYVIMLRVRAGTDWYRD